MTKLWIRPVGRDALQGFALCRTNGAILVDEQIVEHFPKDATGKEIKTVAVDAGLVNSPEEVEWGNVL
ncbi:MAG: hypothetical protein HC904_16260 [Blastochloris sp.]|nr:hypothetical protein [Blastochloris sp.]